MIALGWALFGAGMALGLGNLAHACLSRRPGVARTAFVACLALFLAAAGNVLLASAS